MHADHLNRPIAITDGSKSIVAAFTWEPFGGQFSYSGTQDIDLRFPGQRYQAESGLHYNWHRQYDPTTGRYTQPDPLGLIDGPSRYAYVNNDPLQKVDPTGRQFIGSNLTEQLALQSVQLALHNNLRPGYQIMGVMNSPAGGSKFRVVVNGCVIHYMVSPAGIGGDVKLK